MSEVEQLTQALEALIEQYGGHTVHRVLETKTTWGIAELERLLNISKHVMEESKRSRQSFIDEIIEIATSESKS